MKVEAAARALFWSLIAADEDLHIAQTIRARFKAEHFWCKCCDKVKHRREFYPYGSHVAYPCITCSRAEARERKQEAKQEAGAAA